jgi:hypothetical protein
MELRAYEVGDENLIPAQVSDWHRQVMSGLALVGHMLTIESGGQVVVVIGGATLWAGVGEVWSLVHPNSGVPARALVRIVKSSLEDWAKMEKLWRVNAMAMDDKQMRWMRLLGFEHEYTQRRGGPEGIDLHGMVKWIRGVH